MADVTGLRATIERIVRVRLSRIDYLALYVAKVASQNSDGTLELLLEDKRVPHLSKIPIRYGLPGIKAKVAVGAKVLVGFANGDPNAPFAALWDEGTLTEITITASSKVVVNAASVELGGQQPFARIGDAVMVPSLGAPAVLVPGAPMAGTIISGSTKVKGG